MVSSIEESQSLIYEMKLSSVGPGRMTGVEVVHELSSMDLAMKLHYLRGVYYFRSQAFQDLNIIKIKEVMFTWLNHFYITCGRLRRSESGRPYIKCNDCGVRVIEAQCGKNLEEWLEMKDISLQKLLVSNQPIGPDLPYSPLVLLQLTKFKCGGISMGLSWAHILGDAFSVAEYINMLGQFITSHQPDRPINPAQSHPKSETKNGISPNPPIPAKDPLPLKRVDPVGDNWISSNNCKMETISFQLSATQLSHLQSKVSGKNDPNIIPPFESICAIIWHCIAKIRNGPEPKLVTICKKSLHNKKIGILSNNQVISVVNKPDFSVIDADPNELAMLITNHAVDERRKIEAEIERDDGLSDFIVYGANLTFVDLEETEFYGMEVNGHKPVYVNYTMGGVGDEGVVLVLPGPRDGGKDGVARIVNITLPEDQVLELKAELKNGWPIV